MSYDITHYRGDTFQGVTVSFSLSGNPVDLTDASILLQIKANSSDDTAKLEASTTNGKIVITDAANGTFTFLVDEVIDLPPKEYVYDVQVTLASGRVITPIQNSSFTITADVSR